MAKIDLLKQSRDWFASIPESKIDMDRWADGINPNGKNENFSCLTVGCWAGWNGVFAPFVALGLRVSRWGEVIFNGEIGTAAMAAFFEIDYEDAEYITSPNSYGNWNNIPKSLVLEHIDTIIKKYETSSTDLHQPVSTIQTSD